MERISDKLLSTIRGQRKIAGSERIGTSSLPKHVRDRVLRHRKRHRRSMLILIALVALVSASIAAALFWPLTSPTGERRTAGQMLSNLVAKMKPLPYYFGGRENVYILLIGVDKEPPHRSDTVIVANLDLNNEEVNLLSVPRDTMVSLPGGRRDKLAHAYAFGENGDGNGKDWVRYAVEELLGIEIPYYAVMDFDGFVRVVDTLGGVEIDVEKPLRYTDRSQDLVIDIPAGRQKLNGEELLKYVRFRHDALGDIGRTARQQEAILSIMEKIKNERDWKRVFLLVKTFISSVQTNLSLDQLVALARRISDFDSQSLHATTLEGKPEMINGVSYYLASAEQVSKALSRLNGESEPLVGQEGEMHSDFLDRDEGERQ